MNRGDKMSSQVFKSRMRIARNRANLTQLQLSELVNVPRTTLAYYENSTNDSMPSYEMIHEIAKVLNVSDNFLLGLDDYTSDLHQLLHDTLGLSENSIELLIANKKNLDLGISGINYHPEKCIDGLETVIKMIIPENVDDIRLPDVSEPDIDDKKRNRENYKAKSLRTCRGLQTGI